MKKTFIFCMAYLCLLFSFSTNVLADDEPLHIFLDGKRVEFAASPFIENGSALVPFRALFEQLGTTVGWDGETNTVSATYGETTLMYTIGELEAFRDSQKISLPVAGRIVEGSAFIPVRLIGEAIGATVGWEERTRTILISTAAKRPATVQKVNTDYTVELLPIGEASSTSEKVHLIGVGPSESACSYESLIGQTVYFEHESSFNEQAYGYLYLEDGQMLNIQMLAEGCADHVKMDSKYRWAALFELIIERFEQTPDPSDGKQMDWPDSLKVAPIPLAEPLSATVLDTASGFQIEFKNARSAAVMQSFYAPQKDAVLHVVRRTGGGSGEETWYRKDLLVVKPDTKETQTFKLMHGYTDDLYTTDSVTRVYGFLDKETIIFVSVHGIEGAETFYNIEKMNIYTGEKTVLFEMQPAHEPSDFYSSGWLTEDKSKLVLYAFISGKLQVFDLHRKNNFILESRFPSSWPVHSISQSPDGERFWYHGILYDLKGRVLSELAVEGSSRLELHWSPDSQFAAQHYAIERGPEHSLTGEERDTLASQGLVFIDRDGAILQQLETNGDTHLQLVGWVPSKQTAIIEYYHIDKTKPTDEQKINAEYKAINVRTGERKSLSAATLDRLHQIELAAVGAWPLYDYRTYGYLFFTDLESGIYWKSSERATYMGQTEDGDPIWMTIHDDQGESALRVFRLSNRKIERVYEEMRIYSDVLLFKQWLVSVARQNADHLVYTELSVLC